MVFGIQFEKQFEHGGGHFEIVDQEMVDRRSVNHLERRTRIGILPFENHLLVFGQ